MASGAIEWVDLNIVLYRWESISYWGKVDIIISSRKYIREEVVRIHFYLALNLRRLAGL